MIPGFILFPKDRRPAWKTGSASCPFLSRRSAMAVINRNSLVLFSVSVNRDVVTGTMGNGIDAANHKTAGIPFLTRRQSQGFPLFDQEPQQQPSCAGDTDADCSAAGAG